MSRPPARIMHDLTDVLCRKYRITRPDFDPECIHARRFRRDKSLLWCAKCGHDPLLEADCRGCPDWEPPDAERTATAAPTHPAAEEAAR